MDFQNFDVEALKKLEDANMEERIQMYNSIPKELLEMIFPDFKLKDEIESQLHEKCTLQKMEGFHEVDVNMNAKTWCCHRNSLKHSSGCF